MLPPLDFKNKWREIRLDIDPSVKPDIVASIVDLAGVQDNSIDIVFSKHNLEHLFAHEVPLCLEAFLRVLKPTGFVIIRVPNLTYICEKILELGPDQPLYTAFPAKRPAPICALDMLYGWAAAIADGNVYMSHKTAFTQKSLCVRLQTAGFDRHFLKLKSDITEISILAMKRSSGNILFDLTKLTGK